MPNTLIPDVLIPSDEDSFDVINGDYYPVFLAIAKAARAPKKAARALEIGTRYGYSASVLAQAGFSHITCIDADVPRWGGRVGAFAQAETNLRSLYPGVDWRFVTVDSQTLVSLDYVHVGGSYELIYVDGDHSVKGLAHDLALAKTHLAPNRTAALVVDDMDWHPELRPVVEAFAAEREMTTTYFADDAKRGRMALKRTDITY